MTDVLVALAISMIANFVLIAVNNYLIFAILRKHDKKESSKNE